MHGADKGVDVGAEALLGGAGQRVVGLVAGRRFSPDPAAFADGDGHTGAEPTPQSEGEAAADTSGSLATLAKLPQSERPPQLDTTNAGIDAAPVAPLAPHAPSGARLAGPMLDTPTVGDTTPGAPTPGDPTPDVANPDVASPNNAADVPVELAKAGPSEAPGAASAWRRRARLLPVAVGIAVAGLVWLWFRIAAPNPVPVHVLCVTMGVTGMQAAWLTARRRSAGVILGVVLLDATLAIFAAQVGVGGFFKTPALPNAADNTSHFMVVDYLRDFLLPRGRITGWSPESAGGWPVLRVYFPFAFLAAGLLSTSWFGFVLLPADLAYKMVVLGALFGYPVAAYVCARQFGLRRYAPGLVALVASIFLYDVHQVGLGGNLASLTMGELAYSWSIVLALLALGMLNQTLETRRRPWRAMLLVTATMMAHIVGAMAFMLGAVCVLVFHFRRGGWRRWLEIVAVGAAGAGLWLLPFLNGIPLSTNFGYSKHVEYRSMLLKWTAVCKGEGCGYSYPSAQVAHIKYVFIAGVIGLVWGLVRRQRFVLFLAMWAGTLALAFRFMPEGVLWNVRVTPFYDVAIYMAGGVGAGAICQIVYAIARRVFSLVSSRHAPRVATALASCAFVVCAALPVWHITRVNGVSQHWSKKFPVVGSREIPTEGLTTWTGWFGGATYGIQGHPGNVAEETNFSRIGDFVEEFRRIARQNGCGRMYLEPGQDPSNGVSYNQTLWNVGYWTNACIGSIQTHYYEGSPMSGYWFLADFMTGDVGEGNMRLLPYRDKRDGPTGIKMMRELGVRYLALHGSKSIPDAEATPGMVQVGAVGTWKIFEISDMKLAEGLTKWPANLPDYGGEKPSIVSRALAMGDRVPTKTWPWLHETIEWLQAPDGYAQKYVEGGPADWPEANVTTLHDYHGKTFGSGITVSVPQPADVTLPAVVSNIKTGPDWVSFDVDRSNVPVIVRIPYDPMWVASGASQPVRSTPNFMVIVPHDKHVVLRALDTRTDRAGWVVTLVAVAAGVGVTRRWRKEHAAQAAQERLWADLARRAAGGSPVH